MVYNTIPRQSHLPTCLSAVLYLDLGVKANHELALVVLLGIDLSDVASSL